MRRFYLENEYGQRWSLNSLKTGFLTDPEGLGYELDAGYAMIGDSFLRTYMKAKQSQVSRPRIRRSKLLQTGLTVQDD